MIRPPALQVERLVNPPLGSNTYVLTGLDRSDRLVIDPGTDAVARLAGQAELAAGRISRDAGLFRAWGTLPVERRQAFCLFVRPARGWPGGMRLLPPQIPPAATIILMRALKLSYGAGAP
jgi:hypothetical protein